MYQSLYSIRYQLTNPDGYSQTHLSQVHAKALRALGLTWNATGRSLEVDIKNSTDQRWAVIVPAERAEEYAKQLWKDSVVTAVTIDGTDFPKPTTAPEDSEELKAFKKRVAKVAMKYARDNNWCDEVKRALKELGIEPVAQKARVVLEIDLGDAPDLDLTNLSDVNDHLFDLDRIDLFGTIKSVESIKD